jgi:hypothetical protein
LLDKPLPNYLNPFVTESCFTRKCWWSGIFYARKSQHHLIINQKTISIMPDDKNKTGKADDSRINVNEAYEVKYWSDKFGCSEEQLRQAVQAVGPMVNDVEKYLKKK